MKLRLTAMLLVLAALLSGCTAMLERTYVSSTAHVEYTLTEDSSTLRAESYRGLVDAILYFVNEHAGQGTIRLYNYTTNVEEDMDAACREVMEEDPLGAFAVKGIDYTFSRIVSYYEVTVTLTYSHTAQEVDAIQSVSGVTAIQQRLRQAMADFSSSLVLRASYFTGSTDLVRSMAAQAYFDTPQAAFGLPEIRVVLYPDSGTQRILEITLQWPEEQEVLATRSESLIALVLHLFRNNPPAGDSYTPKELTALLRQTAAPVDGGGAADPYSALSGQPANLLAHTLALELLLQQAGFDVTLVNGMVNGSDACWLILDAGAGYRHLLLTDEEPTLYTDLELTALGYLWNADLYPDCVDYDAALPSSEEPENVDSSSEPVQTPEE